MTKKLCVYLLTMTIGLTCGYLFAGEEIEVPISEPTTEEFEQSLRDFQAPLEDSFESNCTAEECAHEQ